MRPTVIKYDIYGEENKIGEGVFFFDADVIDDKTAKNLITRNGIEMDNSIFKKDAPCFFLPKAQADILQMWVKQSKEDVYDKTILEISEQIKRELKNLDKYHDGIINIYEAMGKINKIANKAKESTEELEMEEER